jgi:murein L,D-transpeptidase YafK
MKPFSLPGFRAAALLTLLLGGHAAPAAPAGYKKHEAPIPSATLALMKSVGTSPSAPLLIRIYKKEAELEVWKRSASGRFVRLKTFPICRWSGQLGPKRREGDRQAPEGFYAVTPGLMNPNSAHYLSFDTGFPNAYDRAQGATGSALMVHGTCSSAGCYAMTDEGIAEIYALLREAFEGGQKAVQLQAYPFRMTPENLVRHRMDPNIGFWRQLKEGSDRFEATGQEPVVTVRAGRYAFIPFNDPDHEAAVAHYRSREEDHVAALIAEGRPAVRTAYVDGGQHPIFMLLARQGVDLGDISQPEALAYAGREVPLTRPGGTAAAARPIARPLPEPLARTAPAQAPPAQRDLMQAARDLLPGGERLRAFAAITGDPSTDAAGTPPAPRQEAFTSVGRGVVGRDIVYPPGFQTRPACGPYGSCISPPAAIRRTSPAVAPRSTASARTATARAPQRWWESGY